MKSYPTDPKLLNECEDFLLHRDTKPLRTPEETARMMHDFMLETTETDEEEDERETQEIGCSAFLAIFLSIPTMWWLAFCFHTGPYPEKWYYLVYYVTHTILALAWWVISSCYLGTRLRKWVYSK